MPKKLRLDSDFDKDFTLFGIASHQKDYRLIWSINERMQIHLIKMEDLKIYQDKKNEFNTFSLYYYNEPTAFKSYYFLSNAGEKGLLFAEQRQTNFFLLIKGNVPQTLKNEISNNLSANEYILKVHTIPISAIKNINNFLSDLELYIMEIHKKEKKEKDNPYYSLIKKNNLQTIPK